MPARSSEPVIAMTAVMQHLKQATHEAHRDAERRPLMRAIAQGTIPRERFIAHLEQLLLVHRALEPRLEEAIAGRPAWGGIVPAERRRVPDLEADLGRLGGSLAPAPLPVTGEALRRIARAEAPSLLGMFYVVEGSTNGGRFLAKPVARALGLPAGERLRALDPYGEEQPVRWESFKAAMNAAAFTAAEMEQITAGACEMFARLGAIADAVAGPDAV